MAYIRTIADDEAQGLLARIYQAGRTRAGKVFNVLRVQGLQPRSLRASTALYRQVMFDETALSRIQCEMLAVTVSRTNACEY